MSLYSSCWSPKQLEISYCICICRDVFRESGIEVMCDELDKLSIQYGVTKDEVKAEILNMGAGLMLSDEEKIYLMTRQFNG